MAEMSAVVGWYGPYRSVADAHAAATEAFQGGLYVAFGYKELPAIGRPRFLYVGIAKSLKSRVTRHHETIGDGKVTRITSIWLGSIDSHGLPGRRKRDQDPLVGAVEWAMVALFRPLLNKRKTTFPATSFAIINRWWSGEDYETQVKKPIMIWPDVIECAGPAAPAHLCWLDQLKVRQIKRPL